MYQLPGEYSQMRRGSWEQMPCVVTISESCVAIDVPGQELTTGNIEQLPFKVQFHHHQTEVTDGLKALKANRPEVYAALTAKYPVRASQAHLMGDA